jgi:hypothetical protein
MCADLHLHVRTECKLNAEIDDASASYLSIRVSDPQDEMNPAFIAGNRAIVDLLVKRIGLRVHEQ